MVGVVMSDHMTLTVMLTLSSYQDNNQHEEAVRDLEKMCQLDRSRGNDRPLALKLVH